MTHPDPPVAIVTGASRGLGRAFVEALLRRGYRVGCLARESAHFRRMLSQVDAASDRTLALACDIRDTIAVDAAVQQVVGAWGRVDVLVNNAGVGVRGPVRSFADTDWASIVDTNLSGAFRCTRAVLPVMERQGSGHVFMISSFSAETAGAEEAPYGASKRALQGFARALGEEVRAAGVQVTVITPGDIDKTRFMGGGVSPEDAERYRYSVPAAELASLLVECLDRTANVWVREVTISPLIEREHHERAGDAGLELRQGDADARPPLRVRRPLPVPHGAGPDVRAFEAYNANLPAFVLDVGDADDAPTPTEHLFRVLRHGAAFGLGRGAIVGRAPLRFAGLLETVCYGRLHGVDTFSIRTDGERVGDGYLVSELVRLGVTAWELAPRGQFDPAVFDLLARALDGVPGARLNIRLGVRHLAEVPAIVGRLGGSEPNAGPALGLALDLFDAAADVDTPDAVVDRLGAALTAADAFGLPFHVEGLPGCLLRGQPERHFAFPVEDTFDPLLRAWAVVDRPASPKPASCESCALTARCSGPSPWLADAGIPDLFRPVETLPPGWMPPEQGRSPSAAGAGEGGGRGDALRPSKGGSFEPWLKSGDDDKVVVHVAVERLSIREARIANAGGARLILDHEPPTADELAENPYVAYVHIAVPAPAGPAEHYRAPFGSVAAPGSRESMTARLKVKSHVSMNEPTEVSDGSNALIESIGAAFADASADGDALTATVDDLIAGFRRAEENSSE